MASKTQHLSSMVWLDWYDAMLASTFQKSLLAPVDGWMVRSVWTAEAEHNKRQGNNVKKVTSLNHIYIELLKQPESLRVTYRLLQ